MTLPHRVGFLWIALACVGYQTIVDGRVRYPVVSQVGHPSSQNTHRDLPRLYRRGFLLYHG